MSGQISCQTISYNLRLSQLGLRRSTGSEPAAGFIALCMRFPCLRTLIVFVDVDVGYDYDHGGQWLDHSEVTRPPPRPAYHLPNVENLYWCGPCDTLGWLLDGDAPELRSLYLELSGGSFHGDTVETFRHFLEHVSRLSSLAVITNEEEEPYTLEALFCDLSLNVELLMCDVAELV
jgi:hypothetical protein